MHLAVLLFRAIVLKVWICWAWCNRIGRHSFHISLIYSNLCIWMLIGFSLQSLAERFFHLNLLASSTICSVKISREFDVEAKIFTVIPTLEDLDLSLWLPKLFAYLWVLRKQQFTCQMQKMLYSQMHVYPEAHWTLRIGHSRADSKCEWDLNLFPTPDICAVAHICLSECLLELKRNVSFFSMQIEHQLTFVTICYCFARVCCWLDNIQRCSTQCDHHFRKRIQFSFDAQCSDAIFRKILYNLAFDIPTIIRRKKAPKPNNINPCQSVKSFLYV